ncbi:hypothetical protein [Streptomyces lydicus]|uniref:hypothetical protein n=1 Tax=Streptomyces lydicus TaxID=47763 RepID=UPI0036EDC3C5
MTTQPDPTTPPVDPTGTTGDSPASTTTALGITFVDHVLPSATAGTYHVAVEQILRDADDNPLNPGDPLKADHSFEIRAPQFKLDASSVHAFHPAPGSAGDFTRTLPHVTLTRAPLPWEREQRWSRADRRAPWIALLLFGPGELPGDPQGRAETDEHTVAELVTPGGGVLGPALTGLPPETLSSLCRTIDVPVALFNALVPREPEMHYLAHVREVKEMAPQRSGEVFTEGTFGVLTGNRFPRRTGDYAVHVVSFEGFEGKLGGNVTGYTAVRLASLWAWSFRCDTGAAFDAEGILRNLVEPGCADPENLALRLRPPAGTAGTAREAGPTGPAADLARERLGNGYVPVGHRVLSGERTYAWYRGPATPVTAQPVPPSVTDPGTYTTADHALIYEREHGLCDVGYATAWTLGRTIGLADPAYATGTLRARRELADAAVRFEAVVRAGAAARAGAVADPHAAMSRRRHLAALHELARHGVGRAAAPVEPSAQTLLLARATALRAVAERGADPLAEWVDRLALLHGVPFAYLVPDVRMLPPESLRMFRVDRAWIGALIAGAQSVGLHTELDRELAPDLCAAVTARSATAWPAAGLLIRSALVSAWPELRVRALRGNAHVAELRRDHPDPDVLLCLFDQVPDQLILGEPTEGIHFGIDSGGTGQEDRIGLRQLQAGGIPPLGASLGTYFPVEGSVITTYLRENGDGPDGVLRVLDEGGREGLVTGLGRVLNRTLGPRHFAVELINAPLEQRLTLQARQ